MMSITDKAVLKNFEDDENSQPNPWKFEGGRTIYGSRSISMPDEPRVFVLCDFGDAQFGDSPYRGEVMPDLYRAPELLLQTPWDHKIDI